MTERKIKDRENMKKEIRLAKKELRLAIKEFNIEHKKYKKITANELKLLITRYEIKKEYFNPVVNAIRKEINEAYKANLKKVQA